MHTGNQRLVVTMLGLPTKLGDYGLRMILILLPVMFLLPVIVSFLRKQESRKTNGFRVRHGMTMPALWRKCLCLLLAYLMLITPTGLEQIAHASSQYHQITTGDWGTVNRTIEYSYDANGSCISKITKETSSGDVKETIAYDYNLRNKLECVTTSYKEGADDINDVAEYTYNDAGDRVRAYSYSIVNGGQPEDAKEKKFLIDPYNHTGYSQILLEYTNWLITTYTIGDDVITYSDDDYGTMHMLYDGHGSTRQLTDSSGDVFYDQVFNYDGYGVRVGYTSEYFEEPLTSMLYAGEYYDNNLRQYNLRARWYDPLNGRFNQLDPYAGNNSDPQSLHKYLYCHANPVNAIDPSGEMSLTELTVTISIIVTIAALTIHSAVHTGWGMKEEIRQMERSEAVTFMSKGLQEQMSWENLLADNPEVLQYNMEWWHEKAGLNKAVTLYNAKTEMNLLRSIDATYHSLEIAGIGLGFAGGVARTPIFWSKPHPPTNPAHWETIQTNVIRHGKTGEIQKIYTNSALKTITNGAVNSDLRPDWAEVLRNGKFRIYEIRSPKQKPVELLEKGWVYKQLLGNRLEYYDVIEIGGMAP